MEGWEESLSIIAARIVFEMQDVPPPSSETRRDLLWKSSVELVISCTELRIEFKIGPTSRNTDGVWFVGLVPVCEVSFTPSVAAFFMGFGTRGVTF